MNVSNFIYCNINKLNNQSQIFIKSNIFIHDGGVPSQPISFELLKIELIFHHYFILTCERNKSPSSNRENHIK